MNKILLVSFVVLIGLTCTEPAKRDVDKTEISPYLFGQNLGLNMDSGGYVGNIDSNLWPKIRESGVSLVRIGGNSYDKSLPNNDTLSAWVKHIKEFGAEPLLQVSKHKSANEAAALVKYFNIDKNIYIKYWSIGNDPCNKDEKSIEEISAFIKKYSSAMKAIDPSIKIFVPDATSYFPELYEKLLMHNKNSIAGRDAYGNWYVDGITFHLYPNGKDYSRADVVFNSVSKMRGMMMKVKNDIELANIKYNRQGADKLLWGITEFNITYSNPEYLGVEGVSAPSFLNGQFWVDVFGLCMEYGAFTASAGCIQESTKEQSDYLNMKDSPNTKEYPSYYHLQMMAKNMKGEYIKMKTDNPFVKAFGTSTKYENSILIMNQDVTQSFDFDFSTLNGIKTGKNILIDTNKEIEATYSGKIEPNTTLLFVFNKKGSVKKLLKYNLDMAAKHLPPKTII